ncbi:hypothetical protein HT031_000826 [Scenedesmus sp. PABB004]|nr:hypothetical protein HT031_000826 [Scenedesmus sp. PABB004]
MPAPPFWVARGRPFLGALSCVILVALFAEWSSVRSASVRAGASSGGKFGWNDSRHLQMQDRAEADQAARIDEAGGAGGGDDGGAAAAAAALVGAAAATGPASVRGTTFTAAFPELGAEPDVEALQPTIWGPVAKKGHLAWEAWSTKQSEARFDSFLSWRLNRTLRGQGAATRESYTCAAADHPPLPFPGCHVFINHKYKYIYIRSPKAASTSIVDELGECNNVRTRGHNASTCMGMHSSWEHFYRDPKNITDMWRDYYVFGFVRNPWKRAYSLFKYMQSDGCMLGDNVTAPRCQMDWSTFCTDPWGSSDRVADAGCLYRSKSYMYFHMMDQHHCMVTQSGDWAVDFVGRVESANEDWTLVVKAINARRDAGLPELPYNPLVPKNVRAGNVSRPYGGAHAHCLDAVSRWYACDMEKFGYLKSAPRGGGAPGGRRAARAR